MTSYLQMLRTVMETGDMVATGAKLLSEGRKPHAVSVTGYQFVHDLRAGFPAVTTKKLYWESVVKELLWFLRGETNVKTLGCGIWNQWTDEDGNCGPIYGEQWRRWEYWRPSAEGERPSLDRLFTSQDEFCRTRVADEWDQFGDQVSGLKAVAADPYDRRRRRLVVSAWNAPQVRRMKLAPCHTLFQVLPVNGRLDLVCHWRSIDLFTGAPFNIASYALLLSLLARVAGMEPGFLKATIADAHIYDNQFDSVREQLDRTPRPHPTLAIAPEVFELAPDLAVEQCRLLKPEMFRLEGYSYDARPLKAEIAV